MPYRPCRHSVAGWLARLPFATVPPTLRATGCVEALEQPTTWSPQATGVWHRRFGLRKVTASPQLAPCGPLISGHSTVPSWARQ
jgi:hypothetical protein